MGWILLIIVGAIIGWLASLLMKTNEQQGAVANILIGVVGSVLGRWLFFDVLGFGSAGDAGEFSVIGIFWGVAGAAVLILILKALRVLK